MTYQSTHSDLWEVDYHYDPPVPETRSLPASAAVVEIDSVTDEQGLPVSYDWATFELIYKACMKDAKEAVEL